MGKEQKNIFFHKLIQSSIHIYKTTKIFRVLIFLLFIYVLFLDSNSLIVRFVNNRTINRLKSEIKYYEKEIEENKKQVKELNSNKENLEKFAREKFLMKKRNEDIFIIETDD